MAIAALAVTLSGATATSSIAATGVANDPTKATLSAVHGIPNTPVTVYLNNKVIIDKFLFGQSDGGQLKPGTYKLDIRPYRAPATSVPILTRTFTLVAGYNATVVVNLTSLGKPVLSYIGNPTTDPATGNARVIVRHMAEAPGVDVYAGPTTSAPLISNLVNGRGAGAEVLAGSYNISVFVHGKKTAPVIGPANFTFEAGKTYIITAIGSAVTKPATLRVVTQSYQNLVQPPVQQPS